MRSYSKTTSKATNGRKTGRKAAPMHQTRASSAAKASTQKKQNKKAQKPAASPKTDLDGDDLMLIVKSIPDKMDRWQAAAAIALAGGFGNDWREQLQPFWLHEAQHLFPDNSFLQGPFKTKQSKKRAAKIAHLPVESLPQTVPPELVAIARRILLERQTEREIQAMDAREDINLDAHITLSRALSEYQLNHHDIQDLVYVNRRNPHGRNFTPMHLFTLRDVIRTAYLKHGGPDGLKEAQEKSALRKEHLAATKEIRAQRRREKLERERAASEARRQQRKDQLVAALAERGLQLRSDSHLCDDYIEYDESEYPLDEIVDIMHEMNFYFKHTKYKHFQEIEHDDFYEEHGYYDYEASIEVSEYAKSSALSDLIKEIGVQGVLAIPNLPPTIRRRLLREYGASLT
jgi:hypothetical protein